MQYLHYDENGNLSHVEIYADGWEKCPDCDGEGTFTDMYGDELYCPTCKGEGEIESPANSR